MNLVASAGIEPLTVISDDNIYIPGLMFCMLSFPSGFLTTVRLTQRIQMVATQADEGQVSVNLRRFSNLVSKTMHALCLGHHFLPVLFSDLLGNRAELFSHPP